MNACRTAKCLSCAHARAVEVRKRIYCFPVRVVKMMTGHDDDDDDDGYNDDDDDDDDADVT